MGNTEYVMLTILGAFVLIGVIFYLESKYEDQLSKFRSKNKTILLILSVLILFGALANEMAIKMAINGGDYRIEWFSRTSVILLFIIVKPWRLFYRNR